jgi:tetratricopeptide (TPR) repeat protein
MGFIGTIIHEFVHYRFHSVKKQYQNLNKIYTYKSHPMEREANKLEKKYQEGSYAYNKANIKYDLNKYDEAIELLNKADQDDVFIFLASKNLLIKIYYELDYIDSLEYLMGSLLVGLSFAKSLACALNLPFIGINHMQGHILAHFINDGDKTHPVSIVPTFPFLCLTVSGGHTQLVKVNDHLNFKILGETIDDAVGEAFDKAAKIMGLPYPGGPLIDKFAQLGDPEKFKFAGTKVPGYDYSFSGIKTSFLYFIQNNIQKDKDFIQKHLNDICASYQKHLVEVLLKNVKSVLSDSGIKQLAISFSRKSLSNFSPINSVS